MLHIIAIALHTNTHNKSANSINMTTSIQEMCTQMPGHVTLHNEGVRIVAGGTSMVFSPWPPMHTTLATFYYTSQTATL